MPPLTVASLATISTSRPETRPTPVTMPAAGRLVVVEIPGRERRQLEERRPRVEQLVDPLADRQLALLAVALEVFRPASLAHRRRPRPQLGHERGHPLLIGAELLRVRVDVRLDDVHVRRGL